MTEKKLYVRIKPKMGVERFFRCGIQFNTKWSLVIGADDATTERLQEEQMLEVSETRPDDYEGAAGDSADQSGTGETKPPADAPTDPAERLAAIRAAIDGLDKEDESLWMADGRPKVDAVSKITGWLVTASERDEAVKAEA